MSGKDKSGLGDELIQKYLDGEAREEEKLEVEKMLLEDASSKRRLEEYRLIGELISEAADMQEVNELLDTKFDAILGKARDTGGTSLLESLKVAAEEFFLHRKRVWIPAAASVVAAVSTLALVLSLTGGPPDEKPAPVKEEWSRVTSVSLGANTSMVMEMEDEAGNKATVLWVLGEPEGGAGEGRTEGEPAVEDAKTDN